LKVKLKRLQLEKLRSAALASPMLSFNILEVKSAQLETKLTVGKLLFGRPTGLTGVY
jgi:hypothetical protein